MALIERAPETVRPALADPGSAATDFCGRAGLDRAVVRGFLAGHLGPETLPEPAWGPIGKVVFERTYAREVPDESRKETWPETVRRVVAGNLSYAPERLALPGEAEDLFSLIYSFAGVPAGRHLWVTGVPEVSAYARNCFSAGWAERTSGHFAFLARRLCEGGGVGASMASAASGASRLAR